MGFRKSYLVLGGGGLLALASLVIILALILVAGLAMAVVAMIGFGGQPAPEAAATAAVLVQAPPIATPTALPTFTPSPTQPILAPADDPAAVSEPAPALDSAAPGAPAVVATATPLRLESPTPTNIPGGPSSPSPTATRTPLPTFTATPSPAVSSTPTQTPRPGDTPTATPTPVAPGRITGRLLLDGKPAGTGTRLKLEDQAYQIVAETTVSADGVYTFADLPPSNSGYNVLFAQEWNEQYDITKVVSWGWIGPVAVASGAVVQLPDFDLSLQGFAQVNPPPHAAVSAATISAGNPLQFEWTGYPLAETYWVDLAQGDRQDIVWQSALVQATSLAFDGRVTGGKSIQPGDYWWGVGARRRLGSYTASVYGYLPELKIVP